MQGGPIGGVPMGTYTLPLSSAGSSTALAVSQAVCLAVGTAIIAAICLGAEQSGGNSVGVGIVNGTALGAEQAVARSVGVVIGAGVALAADQVAGVAIQTPPVPAGPRPQPGAGRFRGSQPGSGR